MKSIPLLLKLTRSNKKGILRTTECISYLSAKQSVSHLGKEQSSYTAMMKDNCIKLRIKFTASSRDTEIQKHSE